MRRCQDGAHEEGQPLHGSLDRRLTLLRAGHVDPRVAPAAALPWLFATEGIQVDDRRDYCRHAIGQTMNIDVDVQPLRDAPLSLHMALQDWEHFRIVYVQGSTLRSIRRGPARADSVSLVLQLDGLCEIGDRRQQVTVGPGDVAIMPPECDRLCAPHGSYAHLLIDLECVLLHELLPQWRALQSRTWPASHPATAAMLELAHWMLRHGATLPDEARSSLALALLALVPRLAQTTDHAPPPSGATRGPMARAQRQRVEDFIEANLADAALDVGVIARELGLSVRYVHKLFAGGPGVMQWVLEQRLLACRNELAQRGARPVSSIAYGWGFASPSHFSRAFRRRFGVSPSQA